MKALSIRQPWASNIIYGNKDIENRSWPSKFTGTFAVHAAKTMTQADHDLWRVFTSDNDLPTPWWEPGCELQRGGIIGLVDMTGCTVCSDSAWFMGEYGFVLENPRPVDFIPCRGKLNFFDLPDDIADQLAGH